MYIGRKLLKNYRRQSAAIEMIKKAVMTSPNGFCPSLSRLSIRNLISGCPVLFLNKLAQTLCDEVSFQKYRFYRFSVILQGSDATDEKNMAIFIISDSNLTRIDALFSVLRKFSF